MRTAATGDDALDALAADPPDLVILDLTTPSSETVLLALHRDRPGTPHILLVPTFGDWQTPRHPAGVVLAMPFGLAELRRALVEVPDAARKQP